MTAAVDIPVVASITADAFLEHRRAARPVVVTPPADDPLARRLAALADPAAVRALLADEPIRIRNGNAAALLTGATSGETAEVPYGSFADRLAADPALELVCSEFSTPSPLTAPAAPPDWALPPSGEDADRVSDMFLAGPAAVAHLHYDGDLRDVVMLQLFGHKRYVLVDPSRSARVLPLTGEGVQRTSGVFVEHLAPADRDAFFAYVGAHVCELAPGSALYMPAGWWHYVEYVDVSLSVNHRLGRTPHLRTLAEQVPVPSVEWLALAQRFRDPDAVERDPATRAAWSRLTAALADTEPLLAADPGRRAAVLERLCLELCESLDDPVAGPPVTVVELERRRRLTASGPHPTDRDGADAPAARPLPDPDEDTPMSDADAATTTVPPDPSTWDASTPVRVPTGSSLFIPVRQPGLVLAQGDQLVGSLPPDPEHHWTQPMLVRIERQPGVTVGELASTADVPIPHVLAFLAHLAAAGWVTAAD